MDLLDLNGFVFTMVAASLLGLAAIAALTGKLLLPASRGKRARRGLWPAVLAAAGLVPLLACREIRGVITAYDPSTLTMHIRTDDGRSRQLRLVSLSRKATAIFSEPGQAETLPGRRAAFRADLWQLSSLRGPDPELTILLGPSPALLARAR